MKVEETGASISGWAEATFGPTGSYVRTGARALEELYECVDLVTSRGWTPLQLGEECADVCIVLARFCWRCGEHDLSPIWQERGRKRGTVLEAIIAAQQHAAKMLLAALRIDEHGDDLCARLLFEANFQAISTVRLLAAALHEANPYLHLPTLIDDKMARNRKRKWRLDGTGHGQHVR